MEPYTNIYIYINIHTQRFFVFILDNRCQNFFIFNRPTSYVLSVRNRWHLSAIQWGCNLSHLTWHYTQSSLKLKKKKTTHTYKIKPKTLKPRDLQRPIISSQNRLLKQLGWMTLRRYPFSRIALRATVTSSNFNTHSYRFEDWQKKNLAPVCMFTHPRNCTEEKVSITAGSTQIPWQSAPGRCTLISFSGRWQMLTYFKTEHNLKILQMQRKYQ